MTMTGVDMNRDGFQTCCNSLRLATALLCRMERLWEPLPLSREQNCPCNLSGCGASFVVDDFTVRFFPGLVNQSLAFSVCAHDSLRLVLVGVFLQLSNAKFVFRGMDVRQVVLRLSIPA